MKGLNPGVISYVGWEWSFRWGKNQVGYSGFQVTGMIEWGQKSKHKKNAMPNFRAIKISRGTMQPGWQGTISNIQIVLNNSQKSLLQSSYPKLYLPKFSYPKKSKILTPKNPLIIPVTRNPEHPLGPELRLKNVPIKYLPSKWTPEKCLREWAYISLVQLDRENWIAIFRVFNVSFALQHKNSIIYNNLAHSLLSSF